LQEWIITSVPVD